MSKMDEHFTPLTAENLKERPGITIRPASAESVGTVLSADENSSNGRSQWIWVRLPNGDLFLGLYPQGDTYFATEHDHPGAALPGNTGTMARCTICDGPLELTQRGPGNGWTSHFVHARDEDDTHAPAGKTAVQPERNHP